MAQATVQPAPDTPCGRLLKMTLGLPEKAGWRKDNVS